MKKLIAIICLFGFTILNAQKDKKDSLSLLIEKEIKTVELKSKKKLVEGKVDRLVFNVKNSIYNTNTDLVEVLNNTPMVTILYYFEKISVIILLQK